MTRNDEKISVRFVEGQYLLTMTDLVSRQKTEWVVSIEITVTLYLVFYFNKSSTRDRKFDWIIRLSWSSFFKSMRWNIVSAWFSFAIRFTREHIFFFLLEMILQVSLFTTIGTRKNLKEEEEEGKEEKKQAHSLTRTVWRFHLHFTINSPGLVEIDSFRVSLKTHTFGNVYRRIFSIAR